MDRVAKRVARGLDRLRRRAEGYVMTLIEEGKGEEAAAVLPFLWGGVPLPPADWFENYFICGSRGAGKTLMLRLLLQTVAFELDRRPWNLVVYDGKNEFYAALCALMSPRRILQTNPYERRSRCWALHKDVPTFEAAWQLASILSPEDKRASQPFFDRAANRIVYGAIVSLMEMKRTGAIAGFSFPDLIFVLQDTERLRALLARSGTGQRVLKRYFDVRERLSDVLATLDTKLAPYEPAALAWAAAARENGEFSLTEFHDECGQILLLGTDETNRAALDPINRALFQRSSEILLSKPLLAPGDPDPRRTFVAVEEASKSGVALSGLDALATKGRGFGVILMLVAQSIAGLEALYGREITAETLGLFANKALLRTDEPYTAGQFSQMLGAGRRVRYSFSSGESVAPGGVSTSRGVSWQAGDEYPVLASFFQTLPPTNTQNGFEGLFLTASLGAYHATLPPGLLFDPAFLIPPAGVPDFDPRYGDISSPPGDWDAPSWLPDSGPGRGPGGRQGAPEGPAGEDPPPADAPEELRIEGRSLDDFRPDI